MSALVAPRHKRGRRSNERADISPRAMQLSYDCPECKEAAFVVVRHPNILRCLHCGCRWEFALPTPEGSFSTVSSSPTTSPHSGASIEDS